MNKSGLLFGRKAIYANLTDITMYDDFSDMLGYTQDEVESYFGEYIEEFAQKTVNSIFASISYTLKIEKNEAYFHTVFYLMVLASGMNVSSEVITSRGRIQCAPNLITIS